jgi:hypothetical protein
MREKFLGFDFLFLRTPAQVTVDARSYKGKNDISNPMNVLIKYPHISYGVKKKADQKKVYDVNHHPHPPQHSP